jgi:hypothetical protein
MHEQELRAEPERLLVRLLNEAAAADSLREAE